jgi:hypothetical protein
VFEIGGLALYEWPEDLSVESGGRVTVNAAAFLDALGRVVPFASTAESRPNINVVRIIPAVDDAPPVGVRGALPRPTRGAVGGRPVPRRVLAPSPVRACMLARLFGGLPDDATLSLGVEETRLLVESGRRHGDRAARRQGLPRVRQGHRQPRADPHGGVRPLLLSAAIRRVALARRRRDASRSTVADEIIVRASGEGLAPVRTWCRSRTDSDGVPVATFALNASMALAALDTI